MMFKPFRSEDFLPSQVREGSEIGVVDSAKLLGLTITSNLPWDDETQLICKKSYVKMWVLKRLKKLGPSISDLLEVYFKQIIWDTEYAEPVWNGSLTGLNVVGLSNVGCPY